MQLVSLSLKNIRSYTKQTIDFSSSMLLVGDIGSGKSTILQAIEFALFGVQRGLQDANYLLRNGEEEGEVSLTFKLDQQITVIRGLKRNKSVAQTPGKLIINGEEELFAPTELRARILELLGYPESSTKAQSLIFRYTVYASQEQMKSIILERAETRLDTLRVIFGIDKYKQIISNAQIYLRELKKEITYLDGSLENLTQLKADLAELKVKHTELSEIVSKQKHVVEEMILDCAKKQKTLSELQEEVDKVKSMQEKLSFINKRKVETALRQEKISLQKNHINREIEKIKDVSKPVDISEKEAQLQREQDLYQRNSILQSTLSSKKTALVEKIADLKAHLSELSLKSVDSLTEEKTDLEKRISAFKDGLDNIESKEKEFTSLQAKKESITLSISEKHSLKDKVSSLSSCPLCKQDVPHSHKDSISKDVDLEISSKQKEIIKISDTIAKLHTIISPKKEFLQKLDSLKESLSKVNASIEQLQKDASKQKDLVEKLRLSENELDLVLKKLAIVGQYSFDSAKELLATLQKDISTQKDLAVLYEKKDGFENQLRILTQDGIELVETMARIEEEEKSVKEKIDLFVLEKHAQLTAEFTESQKLLQEQQIILSNANKDVDYLTIQINSTKKVISEKEEKKKSQTFKIHFKNWLTNYFIPLQKEIETEVLSYIYDEFSSLFTKWFSILLEDDAFSVSIDAQFTPQIQLQGYDISIDSLSGGERTSVALAYRLALNHIVNKLIGLETRDILILDEPTEGFSTEQLDRVRDVLDQLDVPQLLIVSHEQKLDGFVTDVIRIEKGVDGSYLV